MSRGTQYLVTDSYSKGDYGVAGIGVAFRGGRIICGDIVEAPDLLCAELLAVSRAVEIASHHRSCASVIYTDYEAAYGVLCGTAAYESLRSLAAADNLARWLNAFPNISVEYASWETIKSARIVARQTFKAWCCSFNEGVTWSVPAVPEGDAQLEAVAA